jgi:beta-glucosidase
MAKERGAFTIYDAEREKKVIGSKEIVAATKEVALESLVLLRNQNNILPLDKKIKKLAVIGALANSKEDPLGGWDGQSNPDNVVTVLDGIKNKLGSATEVDYVEGCKVVGEDKSGFQSAVKAVNGADAAIVVVGELRSMTGEASSRASLDLPGVQEDMVKELYKTGKPIIVVLMNGRPLSIPWLQNNVAAILETWFAGIQAGNAIADVLFGDYNPNGKLPVTFPRFVGQVPIYYNHKNTGRPHNPGDHFTSYYMDLDNTPLYPFGYGLSYSAFEYSNPVLSKSQVKKDESFDVAVDVKNIGQREGTETVQLYIRDLVGSVTRPVKELKDFEKISLKPGETKHVVFTITPEKLKFYDINMNYVVEPGDFKVFVGTNSADTKEASFTVVD